MKEYFKVGAGIIGIIVIISALGLGIRYVTLPIEKQIERKVLVNSHQYIEGMEKRAAILRANIVEVDSMMLNGQGDYDELMGQKRTLAAQLRAITIQ